MGVALALAGMLFFAANLIVTRYAVARMPLEAGFLLVLSINILFPLVLFGGELLLRTTPLAWDWKNFGLFAIAGVIGTFVGRRALFDTVRILGPSRASIFHSSAPAFAMLGAWLLADEHLGIYEIALVVVVWIGLGLSQPPAGTRVGGTELSAEMLRKGLLIGLVCVAGFGFSNVIRGLAMRGWGEALLGTVIASSAAFLLQLAVTRDWPRIRAAFRQASPGALGLYAACGVTTSLGAIFTTLAMTRLEIGLTVLVVHTTPLVVFPVSVLFLKHREELTGRTVTGAVLVLAGIAALALR